MSGKIAVPLAPTSQVTGLVLAHGKPNLDHLSFGSAVT